jgi:hypothetical protein
LNNLVELYFFHINRKRPDPNNPGLHYAPFRTMLR